MQELPQLQSEFAKDGRRVGFTGIDVSDSAGSGLAFDADGTLWSGDVGEDVFEWACERELLRADPREALDRAAVAHGVPTAGSTSRLAHALYSAYRSGRVPDDRSAGQNRKMPATAMGLGVPRRSKCRDVGRRNPICSEKDNVMTEHHAARDGGSWR